MLLSCGFYDGDETIKVEDFLLLEEASTEPLRQKYCRIGMGGSTISVMEQPWLFVGFSSDEHSTHLRQEEYIVYEDTPTHPHENESNHARDKMDTKCTS